MLPNFLYFLTRYFIFPIISILSIIDVINGLDVSTTPKPAIDSFTSLIWSIPSLK